MTNIDHEKEMIFVKLIRKGPHVLEFSDDYLMVHNGRITLATSPVLEKYRSIKKGIWSQDVILFKQLPN